MPIVRDLFKQMERLATEVQQGLLVQFGPDLLAGLPGHAPETGMGIPQAVHEHAGLREGGTDGHATGTLIRCTAYREISAYERGLNIPLQSTTSQQARPEVQSDVDALFHANQLTPDELSALPCCKEFDRPLTTKSHGWLRQPMLGFFH